MYVVQQITAKATSEPSIDAIDVVEGLLSSYRLVPECQTNPARRSDSHAYNRLLVHEWRKEFGQMRIKILRVRVYGIQLLRNGTQASMHAGCGYYNRLASMSNECQKCMKQKTYVADHR